MLDSFSLYLITIFWLNGMCRNKEKVIINEQSGYLMRTKVSSSNEGGVAAGFAVLDRIYLNWDGSHSQPSWFMFLLLYYVFSSSFFLLVRDLCFNSSRFDSLRPDKALYNIWDHGEISMHKMGHNSKKCNDDVVEEILTYFQRLLSER